MSSVFTVQDDTGSVAAANSYITLAYFQQYNEDRGNSYTGTDEATKQAIVRATDYVDYRFQYVGAKSSQDQSTKWPRSNAVDADDRLVSGIPDAVKEAVAEYALYATGSYTDLVSNPPLNDSGQRIKRTRVKADVVEQETEYADGIGFSMPNYPIADSKLRRAGLIRASNDVVRG